METALLFSYGYELKNQRAEISRNIPDEVLFEEILIRLPVKPLTIYKYVCKKWLHTIESPSFREAHIRRHILYFSDQILFSKFKSISDPVTKSSSLLPSTHSFGPGLIKMTSRPLDVMLPPEMTRINWPKFKLNVPDLAACIRFWNASVCVLGPVRSTGIYCVVAFLVPGHLAVDPHIHWAIHCLPNVKISICNPATRDYKLANPFPPEETARLVDLTIRQHFKVHYGFGLAADGDYKVVVFITWIPPFSGFLSYVYSLKKGAWKKIVDSENGLVSRLDLGGKPDFPEIHLLARELCPQVFVNGCYHWMAGFSDDTSNVLSFDVDNEVFKVILGPPSYRRGKLTEFRSSGKLISHFVSVLNDHLTTLYYAYKPYTDPSVATISVWMMMEYGDEESWINIWTVDLESSPMRTPVGILYSLREEGNGGIHIDRIVFEGSEKQLLSCDEFGVVEEQPDFKTTSCIYWNNLGISAYSETLEPLNIQDSSDATKLPDTSEV